ncbi:MAG: hypothetical protein ABI212_08285 [Burkholderiaceae bacterium]
MAMARVRIFLWFLAGALSFALAFELVLRLLPVATATNTGYYIDPLIRTTPPHFTFKAATGWDLRNAQTIHSNNFGFVADHDFQPDKRAVALIGDSFVEASMLPAQQRPGAQLERALASGSEPARPVYAMGVPGTALLDYVERIRLAHERFDVRDFVLLMERADVRQSFCGSGNVGGPCLRQDTLAPATELQPEAGPIKQVLRHSALAQYLFSQLKFDPARLWQQVWQQARPATPDHMGSAALAAVTVQPIEMSKEELSRLAHVTNTFFERIRPYRDGRLVIVLDSDRGAIRRGDAAIADAARDQFMKLARAEGAVLVDTEPLYREQAAHSELALAVGPYDGHLNPLGIGIAMKAAAQALR